jgi:tripartite-type tricarboxylate transporter receptor subunit TctC
MAVAGVPDRVYGSLEENLSDRFGGFRRASWRGGRRKLRDNAASEPRPPRRRTSYQTEEETMPGISSTAFHVVSALAAGAAVLGAGHARAQSYPAKNVQIIVPYTPGGSIDVVTRAVARKVTELWGRNVVIDNRAGASGMIGAELVAKADPDGYTLLGTTSSYPGTVAIRKSLPFDPVKSFIPVALFGRAPLLLVIHPSVPAHSVKELVALAKKHPGKLNYSSSGTGGNNHFSGALFATAAGVKLTHVPYRGIAQAITAVAAGEVEMSIASGPAVMPQVRAGRIRALGVSSKERSPLLPDLPAIAQAGVPTYSYELWWGLFAPAGTPADRVNAINAIVNKALATDDVKQFLAHEGAEPAPMSIPQLSGLLSEEIARYRKAAEEAGIPQQ